MPRKSWSKGANRAFAAMQKTYGPKLGERVFFAKANKDASRALQRRSQNQRVSGFYKTGGRQRPPRSR